jgi:hypothetical protein
MQARYDSLKQQDELFRVYLRWKRVQFCEDTDFSVAGAFDSAMASPRFGEGLEEFNKAYAENWAKMSHADWGSVLTRISKAEVDMQAQHASQWAKIVDIFP